MGLGSLDVSNFATAEEAAKSAKDHLHNVAEEEFDQNASVEIRLWEGAQGVWHLEWPAGPYEWAPETVGGTKYLREEPIFTGFQNLDNSSYLVEVKNNDTITFRQE